MHLTIFAANGNIVALAIKKTIRTPKHLAAFIDVYIIHQTVPIRQEVILLFILNSTVRNLRAIAEPESFDIFKYLVDFVE